MTLRSQVVDAMAQALFRWNCDGAFSWPRSAKQQAEWVAGGAEILDAALDVLGEQMEGDGWIEFAHSIPALLVVLADSRKP